MFLEEYLETLTHIAIEWLLMKFVNKKSEAIHQNLLKKSLQKFLDESLVEVPKASLKELLKQPGEKTLRIFFWKTNPGEFLGGFYKKKWWSFFFSKNSPRMILNKLLKDFPKKFMKKFLNKHLEKCLGRISDKIPGDFPEVIPGKKFQRFLEHIFFLSVGICGRSATYTNVCMDIGI